MINKIKLGNLSIIQKHILVIFLFALIASILVVSWFRYGHLYGGGDVGIPSYDPQRILDIARFVWWEASAPGTTVPHGLTSVPFQFVQASLQNMGLPYVAIQGLFFWVIIFLMGYGMNLLALSVYGKDKLKWAFLSGLFYIFNPYMMINVWHRFIHSTFFLAAALPFIYIFWTKWIKTGKYIFLFYFLLTNFLSVYLYGTLAFSVVILILLGWLALFEILFPWRGINNLKIISLRFILGIIFWFLIHSWWLLPSVSVAPAIFSLQHTVTENLATLLSISQQAIIPYSILGINPFYIYYQLDFGEIYNHLFFRSLPILILFFLIPGFLKSLLSKKWSIWALTLILGLFLAKGAASPFGHIYIFGFSNIFSLGALRNPFEKTGILIPFSSAILVPLGISFYLSLAVGYSDKIPKFLLVSKILILISLVLVLGIFAWPMWSGRLFGKYDKLALVEVPNNYIKADSFIRNQASDGNILHLPLTTGESATYGWKYGYSGVESSQLYFSSLPSISRGLNIGYVDDALLALSRIFSQPLVDDEKIINLLRAFSVRLIILHKDMEWKGGSLSSPEEIEKILDKKTFLERSGDFGNLVIYKLKDQYFDLKLRLSENIQLINLAEEKSYWPWLIRDGLGDFITPVNRDFQDPTLSHSSEVILVPKKLYSYIDNSSTENIINELPSTRILPGSLLYPLIILKEKILLFSMPETDRFTYEMTIAGKRLVEAYKIKDDKSKSIKSILKAYQDLLPSLEKGIIERKGGGLADGEISLESIFSKHVVVLNQLSVSREGSDKEVIEKTYDKLEEMLKSNNLLPYYQVKEDNKLSRNDRLVAEFEVPLNSKFEILQAHQNSQSVYPGNLMKTYFQIDDEIKFFSGTQKGDFISYGSITLPKGLHEISFYSAKSDNLINASNNLGEVEITSEAHKPGFLEFNIDPVTDSGWYQMTFESWIKLGDKFKVQLLQDTDPKDPSGKEEFFLSFNKTFTRDSYINFWNKYTFNLHLRPATTKASIRFIVEPWDDCRVILIKKKLCEDKKNRFPYEHPGMIALKNIEIRRILTNPIFLKSDLPNKIESTDSGQISFKNNSPVSYSGQIDLKSPQFLIFSETYHPGWKLTLSGDNQTSSSAPYIANLFGNAWYIESPGKYNFTLEFTPQKKATQGMVISFIGGLGIIILTIRQKFKNRRGLFSDENEN